jgi:hypothetical protein
MRPTLDEIRKRLTDPPVPSIPLRYDTPKRVAEAQAPAGIPVQATPPINDSGEPSDPKPELAQRSATQSPSISEATSEKERNQPKLETAWEAPKSVHGLARAVAELFEPARQCRMRFLEIRVGAEIMEQLTRQAIEVRGPLTEFRGHLQRLSASFETMRRFRDELGMVAESFGPLRTLHQQMTKLGQSVQANLAEIAHSLEPATALRNDLTSLAAAIEGIDELQVQFRELAKAFSDDDPLH